MGLAAFLVWKVRGLDRGRGPLSLFGLQLVFNLAWSSLFFGLHAIGWALADIAVLLVLIAATTASFWRIHRGAGILMLPYLLWVSFAAGLNAAIWRLDP